MYFITLSPAYLAVSHRLSIHICTLLHCLQPTLLFLTVSAYIYVLYNIVSSLPCCFSLSQHTYMYFITLSPAYHAVSHCLSIHICPLKHCLPPTLLFLTVSAYIYVLYNIVSSLPCCFSLSQLTYMYFITLSPAYLAVSLCLSITYMYFITLSPAYHAVSHCLSLHICTL